MIKSDFENIFKTLKKVLNEKKKYKKDYRYGKGNSGKQIVKILEKIQVSSQKRLNF